MKGSADDVINAFLLGAEATCRIGMVLGRDHYDAGFIKQQHRGPLGQPLLQPVFIGLTAVPLGLRWGLLAAVLQV